MSWTITINGKVGEADLSVKDHTLSGVPAIAVQDAMVRWHRLADELGPPIGYTTRIVAERDV